MEVLPAALAAVGTLCLTLALILAWCLIGVRTTGFMEMVSQPSVVAQGAH
jgi:hypothetical protein